MNEPTPPFAWQLRESPMRSSIVDDIDPLAVRDEARTDERGIQPRLDQADSRTTIGRLPLPALTPLHARIARFISNTRTLALAKRIAGLVPRSLQLSTPGKSLRNGFEVPALLELAHPAGAIRIALDLAAYPALGVAAVSPRADATLSSPEEALRAAIAGVLLEPLLAHLATLGLHGVHVVRLVHGTAGFAAHDGAQPIAISFTLDGRQHDVEAVLDTPIVSLVEARAAREPVAIAPVGRTSDEALHDVLAQQLDCVIPGRLVLGSRRLPVDTLRALSPGDVLMRSIMSSLSSLVSDAVAQVTATAVAAWGTPGRVRLHVPVAIDGLNLSIIKEATMTDELDPARLNDTLASDATGSPVDLGELDLPVQFEVDTIALPLSQLCALRPGYVLELQTPVAAAQLKLVTHGQTIGIGELVTVGEHLGVRILKMAHGDDSIQ